MELNLKKREKKTLKITMLDGKILNIKKPSEEMVLKMEEAELKLKDAKSFKEGMDIIKPMTIEILNNNTGGTVFDSLLLEQKDEEGEAIYDYDVCMAIYKAYTQFYTEVLSNPN